MLLLYLAIQVNSLHLDLKANAPGVPAIWQAADVLQPLQAWKRFSCVFSSLRLAREKSQHSKGKLHTLEQNLNSLCSKWFCQLWAVPEPVLSCLLLLEEMDMYPADYRCRLMRSKLASAPKAVTKTLPKSAAVLILTFGMWICVADFLPSYVLILLQLFQLCAGGQVVCTSWAIASYIYPWMADLIIRKKLVWQSNTLHGTAAPRIRYKPQVMATSGG